MTSFPASGTGQINKIKNRNTLLIKADVTNKQTHNLFNF